MKPSVYLAILKVKHTKHSPTPNDPLHPIEWYRHCTPNSYESASSVLANWGIRSIVGYPRQSVAYIFILSNQPVILKTNETAVSGVKLYQGDRGSNLAA